MKQEHKHTPKNRSRLWRAAVCGIALAIPCFTQAQVVSVTAKSETRPNFDDEAGNDADADDPAIWVHPSNPSKSVVIGVLKNGGMSVFNLSAQEIQWIAAPPGPGPDDEGSRYNNVDLIYGLKINGVKTDIAVVSDRGRDQIRFYKIDPNKAASGLPPLTDITASNVPWVFSSSQEEVNEQFTSYGLASTKKDGVGYVFTSQRSRTNVAQLKVIVNSNGTLTYTKVRTITLPKTFSTPLGTWTPCLDDDGDDPQVEGLVVDETEDFLYMGQEPVGIWRLKLWSHSKTPKLVEKVREFGVPYTRIWDEEEEEYICTLLWDQDPGVGGDNISQDVEGLTIYYADDDDDDGYLIASSQGDNTFAVFEREDDEDGDNDYIGSFQVVNSSATDSVQESDGAHVINVDLGSLFPKGLFVTQDGDNTPVVLDGEGEERTNSNFKFVRWDVIAKAFSPDLDIEEDEWDPRD
jgi:3-phytase